MANHIRAKVYTKAEALRAVEDMARMPDESYGFDGGMAEASGFVTLTGLRHEPIPQKEMRQLFTEKVLSCRLLCSISIIDRQTEPYRKRGDDPPMRDPC